MKTLLAALALAVGNAAFAADNAPAITQWDQSQERLVRQFSQGFGFGIDQAQPSLVARGDRASVGPTADSRDRHDRLRPRLHRAKLPNQAR